jgi:hypothetical protein
MGRIVTDTKNIHGIETHTEIRTNKLEDFVIKLIWRLLGRERGWRFVHFVERRKLK